MTNDRDKTQPFGDPGAGREETSHTNGGLVATAFGMTDVGMQRSVNQDTLGNLVGQHADRTMDLGLLYAIADGMGGHARGEVASALAIQHLFARYYSGDPGEDSRRMLEKVLIETNGAVHQAGREAGGAAMGTTLTMALLRDNTLYVGNIGDSRTYCIRRGQIEQLTHDHSLIGEQVRSGLLTEAQARQSSIRNVITRAVGYREEVEPDVFTFAVEAGDIVLLCSDGLHSMVDSQELAQQLSMQPLGVAVPALIELAKQRGGPDNITALAVRIDALGASAGGREEATTVPLTPSLNDAVTKPFVRTEGGEETYHEAAAGAAVAAAAPPVVQPPPRSTPPGGVSPALPPARIPAPPASRSSSRFPVALLIVLPLLLLAVAGAALVAIAGNGGGADVTATAPATGPAAGTSTAVSTPTGALASLPASAAGGVAQPSASAVPSLGGIGGTPRSSTSGTLPTPNIGALTPGASPTGTRVGGSENTRTIISGTVTFNNQNPPPGELEIVLFMAADLQGITIGDQPPSASDLASRIPTWFIPVTPQAQQAVSFDVRGEWKGDNTQERAIIALRRTFNGQASIIYPEGDTWLVLLTDPQPRTNYSLSFVNTAAPSR
jgi:protein phosphatase